MSASIDSNSNSSNPFDFKLIEGIQLVLSKLTEKGIDFNADLSAALKRSALMVCIHFSKKFDIFDKGQRLQGQVLK